MTTHRRKWFDAMKKKLGVKTDDEVREYMAKVGMRGKKTGKGGFYYMKKHNPEKLKAVSRKGGHAGS